MAIKRFSMPRIELTEEDLFSSSPWGSLIISEEDVILKANLSFCTSLGYELDELISTPYKSIVTDPHWRIFTEESKKLLSGDLTKTQLPQEYITKGKGTYRMTFHYTVVKLNGNTCFMGYGFGDTSSHSPPLIEPLTGQKDSIFFKALMENFPQAVYFKDHKSQFLKVNEAFIEKYVKNNESIEGKTDFDLFTGEHANQAFKDEQEIIRSGKPLINIEEKETTPDGIETWVTTSKMPLYDHAGNIIGTFGVSRDITSSKVNERAIREKNSILNAITSKMPVVIFKFSVNKGLYGVMGDHTIAEAFKSSKMIRLSIGDGLLRIIDKIESGRDNDSYFSFSTSAIQSEREWHFENYVFKNEAGRDEYIGLALDITERKRSEQNLKRNAKKLEKTNKELNQFAYIISHDLKAPLRAIINLSEWIEEDLGDLASDDAKENLRLMRGRVVRMENLINGILTYSRLTRVAISYEDIAVGPFLREVIDSLMIPKKFKIQIPPDLPVISYPKVNLEQIFANLLSNAVKYHDKPKGMITVRFQDSNDNYEFSISDDGPGIAPEYHEKIFQIFQTLQARDTMESTGIGLTIVKKIIEERGGSIGVESEVGKGSTFTFTIPKALQKE